MLNSNDNQLTFGGHMEVLRRMLFCFLGVTIVIAVIIFLLKDLTWSILLAPSEYDFVTYRYIERIIHWFGSDFHFDKYDIDMIATDLTSQFMTHVTMSLYLGCLSASPYILYKLFRFILPALNENERKYSVYVALIIYALFIIGTLMSYFVIFPISFRFLGTYSVADKVSTMVTLNSYISTFVSLTLVMGVVFQLPVISYILAKTGIVNYQILVKYRRHALIILTIVSAFITPPDIMSCILVTLPLYILYELSVLIAKRAYKE